MSLLDRHVGHFCKICLCQSLSIRKSFILNGSTFVSYKLLVFYFEFGVGIAPQCKSGTFWNYLNMEHKLQSTSKVLQMLHEFAATQYQGELHLKSGTAALLNLLASCIGELYECYGTSIVKCASSCNMYVNGFITWDCSVAKGKHLFP